MIIFANEHSRFVGEGYLAKLPFHYGVVHFDISDMHRRVQRLVAPGQSRLRKGIGQSATRRLLLRCVYEGDGFGGISAGRGAQGQT